MSVVCFDSVGFTTTLMSLASANMDTNVRKALASHSQIKALQAVMAGQQSGLGGLLTPTHYRGRFELYWSSICPTEAGDCGDNDLCHLESGDDVPRRLIEPKIDRCKEAKVITIREHHYRDTPIQMGTDIARLLNERIISLENAANADFLDFLYANRGENGYKDPKFINTVDRITYFDIDGMSDPNSVGVLLNTHDYNSFGMTTVIDGGALHQPLWEASKNVNDDDKRSEWAKWLDLVGGGNSPFRYVGRDLRGTQRFFENKDIGTGRGYIMIEDGVVSFISTHNYPVAAFTADDIANAEMLFGPILDIGDVAKMFGQRGAAYDVTNKNLAFAIPSPRLRQTFRTQTGQLQTVPVYIDVIWNITCGTHEGVLTRTHNILTQLRYGFPFAPNDCQDSEHANKSNGLLWFAESCEELPDPCVDNPCDAICDDLALDADVTSNCIEFGALPISEDCDPSSGFSITNQHIAVYRHSNGSELGEFIAELTNAQLQAPSKVDGLLAGEKYTIVATATYDADGTECVKESRTCVKIEDSANPCDNIDVDFTSTTNLLFISITDKSTGVDFAPYLTAWEFTLVDSAGESFDLGSGTSEGDFPLTLPAGVADGPGTITGKVTVGNCTNVEVVESVEIDTELPIVGAVAGRIYLNAGAYADTPKIDSTGSTGVYVRASLDIGNTGTIDSSTPWELNTGSNEISLLPFGSPASGSAIVVEVTNDTGLGAQDAAQILFIITDDTVAAGDEVSVATVPDVVGIGCAGTLGFGMETDDIFDTTGTPVVISANGFTVPLGTPASTYGQTVWVNCDGDEIAIVVYDVLTVT